MKAIRQRLSIRSPRSSRKGFARGQFDQCSNQSLESSEFSPESSNEATIIVEHSSSPEHTESVLAKAERQRKLSHGSCTTMNSYLDEEPSLSEDTEAIFRERSSKLIPSRPAAGSSTLQIEDTTVPICKASSQTTEANTSLDSSHRADDRNEIQWCQVPGDSLMVRSANYRKTRVKVGSDGELYECIGVDFIDCPKRIPELSSRVDLPEAFFDADQVNETAVPNGKHDWHAPDLFVVTLSIPIDPKAKGDDGPCYTLSMYFKMKDETRRILQSILSGDDENLENNPRANAVRLFNEWCGRSPDDPKFQGRFKLIPHAANLSDLGIPSWISRWSGKPVLIKRVGQTGFLHQQENCLEMEISLHAFPWATKQALLYLKDYIFHQVKTTFGFVIEAREEDELPEVLIGLAQVCYPNTANAWSAKRFFGENDDEKEGIGLCPSDVSMDL